MIPNFSRDTLYNPKANASSIRWGAEAPVLEIELNEMQYIQNKKIADLIKHVCGEGITKDGTLTFTSGTLTIANEVAVVDGTMLYISSLSLASLVNGDKIYLQVWDKVVDSTSTIKEYGNEQTSTLVPNYLVDPNIGVETSRRVVTAYTLSKTNTDSSKKHLLLGTIQNGTFVSACELSKKDVIRGTTAPKYTSAIWVETN